VKDTGAQEMNELEGNVAVLTGAASGIGRALAIALDQEGMELVLVDIEKDKLEMVAQGLKGSALLYHLDISDAAAMKALGEKVYEAHENVHLLINNAGVMGPMAPMWELEESDWDWVFNVNVKGLANSIRTFIPKMLAQNDVSRVVNTASEASFAARAYVGVYHSSKHAVLAMTETLAQELSFLDEKIRVSVVCPGAVKTAVMEADRNRPDELARQGGANETGTKLLDVYRRSIEHGLSAEDVASSIIEGIKADQFYIFPHPEVAGLAQNRVEAIKADQYPEFDPNLANLVR
jgi:NADP-dependent 3-hydroxy acid dehydrogenase YdfG